MEKEFLLEKNGKNDARKIIVEMELNGPFLGIPRNS